MSRILVADDDVHTCNLFRELLCEISEDIVPCHDPTEVVRIAADGSFDLVIADINFEQEMTGIDVLRELKKTHPATEVIVISAYGTLDTAVTAVKEGAFDVISKPFKVEEVKSIVRRALRKRQSVAKLPDEGAARSSDKAVLIGSSARMMNVYKMIAYVSDSTATVLLQGETGTGKELVARAIHDKGPRSDLPFVAVNCGALTETLLESELFGHTRGSFTGATSDKEGLFHAASKGTLFLDEINETSPSLQVKLLRVLQEGEYKPVGSTRIFRTDARVIAATNHDLENLVQTGQFREDLFYRLTAVTIRVPPLRERTDDIPRLIAHFVARLVASGREDLSFSAKALDLLMRYPWPGNVRELENIIDRLSLFFRGRQITPDNLPERIHQSLNADPEKLFEGRPSLEEVERRYLLHVLDSTDGNRSRAAEILKIDRRTLYRMLDRFGVGTKSERAYARAQASGGAEASGGQEEDSSQAS